ncbi:Tripartite motif-containing protein 51 [Plecturocebus cupreus]
MMCCSFFLRNMNSGFVQAFQRALTCPMCMNCFIDPVTIDHGHSFCRPCLYISWPNFPVLARCSECKKTTRQGNLKTDIRVKKMASLIKKASLQQFLSTEEQMCEAHRETKKMFCDVDKSLLCLLCSNSHEHQVHRCCPIEWAAEESRKPEHGNHQNQMLERLCSFRKQSELNIRRYHRFSTKKSNIIWRVAKGERGHFSATQ